MTTLQSVGLHALGMWKKRGDGAQQMTISIPDFDVAPGSFVAVTGPNGCGKSSLLDMLGLLLTPDSVVRFSLTGIANVDLANLSRNEQRSVRRKFFAYALQNGGMIESLTVRQNLLFAASLKQYAPSNVMQVAQFFDIVDILDAYPVKISGGQRQKASLACAFIQKPRIILADEPSAALDPRSAIKIMNVFRRIATSNGITVILVTHAPQLIKNRVDAMFYFRVTANGPSVQSTLTPVALS